jgi:hypothetical protein
LEGVVFLLFVTSIVNDKLYWDKKFANATGQMSELKKTTHWSRRWWRKEDSKKRKNKIKR